MMDSPGYPPGSPLDVMDDSAFPCKGCGDVLEEGKAFELAGNRWHIDCFRCNTCGTLLDSDANLLLLGDGSLICNNCTYSCNACGNKIEDLAILTGDQAFCAGCFRCRNCKRKIENLRYARTSQGIFCMSCHESLMARRRKKSRNQSSNKATGSSNSLALNKDLPPMPPPMDEEDDSSSIAAPSASSASSKAGARLGPPPRPPRPEVSRAGSSGTTTRRGDASPISAHSPAGPTPTRSPYPVHSPPAPPQDPFQKVNNKAKSRQSMYSLMSEENTSDQVSNSDHRASYFPLLLDNGPPPPIPSTIDRSDIYAPRTIPPSSAAVEIPPESARSTTDPSRNDGFQEKNAKRAADNEASRIREHEQRKERERREAEKAEAHRRELDAERQRESDLAKERSSLENLERERQKQRDQSRPKDKISESSIRSVGYEREDSKAESVTSNDNMMSPQSFRSETSIPPPNRPAPGTIPMPTDNIIPSQARKPTSQSENFKLQEVPRTKRATPKLPSDGEEESSPLESELPISFTPEPRKDSLLANKNTGSQDDYVRSVKPSGSRKTNSETEVDATNSEFSNYTSSATSNQQASPGSLHRKAQGSGSYGITPARHRPSTSHSSGGLSAAPFDGPGQNGASPLLPPLKSDLNFEEEIGRIFSGGDYTAGGMKRTSKSVKHGRSHSDMAARISTLSPELPEGENAKEENAALKNALRRSTQQLVELESKLHNSVEVKESLENDIKEKRSTVASLEADKELAMVELSVLREKLADPNMKSINYDDFVASTLQEVASRISAIKESHKAELEKLIASKNEALEDTATAIRMRDQAIQETEQLNSKNMQLADLNNELTRRIQGSFIANKSALQGSSAALNGLGIHAEGDGRSIMTGPGSGSMSETTTLNDEGTAVVAAPHVINIRKAHGQAVKKFNWKKGGAAVGKGVGKAFNKVFASEHTGDHYQDGPMTLQAQPFSSTAYGPPVTTVDSPGFKPNGAADYSGTQRGGLLKKLKGSNQQGGHDKDPGAILFGSELEARVAYEGRRIPLVVTKCLEEVESRGLDQEGIYRRAGGASQIRSIQEAFERGEEIDLEDPAIDITAVTSVLKQYFRKLPTPLVTFTIYQRMVDSVKIADIEERKDLVKTLINELPSLNRDILFFIINHLTKVAQFQSENLMNPRNLSVVFAPSLMRDETGEFELRDTHAKNEALQFLIENAKPIFAGVNL